MPNINIDEAKVIADNLEEEVAALHFKLSYPQIAKIALLTAKKIKEQIPMYQGNLNPKWTTYDFVCSLLNERVNG